MTTMLKDSLAAAAQEAAPWGDPAAAVSAARARRRRSVVGWAAAATACLLALGLAVPSLVPFSLPAAPATGGDGPAGYPQRVGGSLLPLRDLPAAPGAAAGWIATSDPAAPFQLVMPDGGRYRLPVSGDIGAVLDVWPALSDDGRRVAWLPSTRGPAVVQDLVDGQRWTLPVVSGAAMGHYWTMQHPAYFAPDGQRLLLPGGEACEAAARCAGAGPLLVDLSGKGSVTVLDRPGLPVGWLPSGADFLSLQPGRGRQPVQLQQVALDGSVVASTPVPEVRSSEVSQLSGSLSPDGRLLSIASSTAAGVRLTTFRLPDVVPAQSSPAIGSTLWCPAAGWLPGTRTPLVAVAASNQLESDGAAVLSLTTSGDGEYLTVVDPRVRPTCLHLAADALAAGPTWSPLGTRTSWWAWHAGQLLAGVVVLLGAVGALRWVRRRRRLARVSAGRNG